MPEQQYERDKNGIRLDLTGGMNLMLPPDLIPPGQGYPYLQNVRRNLSGRAVSRPSLTANEIPLPVSGPAPVSITSLTVINDTLGTLSTAIPQSWVISDAAGNLYVDVNTPGGPEMYLVVTGYFHGKPLSYVVFRPNASPQPWCYVAGVPALPANPANPYQAPTVNIVNSAQAPNSPPPAIAYPFSVAGMVKVRSDGLVYKTGIAEPQAPPVITTGPGATSGPNWVIYRHRYRSSVTGAMSNPSPETPALVMAQTPANGLTINGYNLTGAPDSSQQYNTNWYQQDTGGPSAGVDIRTVGSVTAGQVTDWVKPSNFGLNVPSNAIIDGVEVTMNWAGQIAGTGQVTGVSLYNNNIQIGSAPKVPNTVNVQYTSGVAIGGVPVTYGGTTDLWGAALTPATVNGSGFGFGVQITVPSGATNTRSFLYTFTLTVYYSLPNQGVKALQYNDPQVDKIDFFRTSPNLENFTFVGTVGNLASAAGTYSSILTDTLSDLDISANPILDFTNFEPFPSIDLPRRGTVNVTTVNQQVSYVGIVDPGSGQTNGTYTVNAVNAPTDTTGSGARVQFTISGGAIISPVTLLSGGSNYTSNPTFNVSAGGSPGSLAAGITPVLPITNNVAFASGDAFNSRWLPGTVILIGGVSPTDASTAWTLYTRPTSSGMIVYSSVIDPISGLPTFTFPPAGTGVTYEIPEPSLAAEPSPVIWGPTPQTAAGGGAFSFGLDLLNPGDLLWTNGNNFDSAADTNRMNVTSPSEALMNGTVTAELSTVFSTERFWLIYPNFADALATVTGIEGQPWILVQSAATRGLYMRYAIAALGAMIAYRAKDCIAVSMGGGPEKSITDAIYNLFPHGGSVPTPVTIGGQTVYPPDDTNPNAQTISISPTYIVYNYQDTTGTPRTLVYDLDAQGWSVDVYSPPVNYHYWPVGNVTAFACGCNDGSVRFLGGSGASSATETGTSMICTRSENGGDVRGIKRVGDVFFKAELAAHSSVGLIFYMAQFTQGISYGYAPSSLVGTGAVAYYTVDFISGFAQDVDDIGVLMFWNLGTSNILDLWQPDWIIQPETIHYRPSDWTECDVPGNKLIRGMIIEMDTFNAAKALQVQRSDSETLITPDQVQVTANGQTLVPFTFQPFTAHMLRIISLDNVPWRYFGTIKWIVDPWPDYTPLYSPWMNLGVTGAKYIRGLVMPMDTNGVLTKFNVITSERTDSLPSEPGHGTTVEFTATTPMAMKTQVAFAFTPPIVAHQVQVQAEALTGQPGAGPALWPDEAQWIFDSYPEITQAYTPVMEISGADNKFFQGVNIVADSSNNFVGDANYAGGNNGQPVSFQVYYDGGKLGPLLGPSTFNGKQTMVYSFNPPFTAHDVQIVPLQPVRMWVAGMGAGVDDTSKWNFQPTPDSATTYTTQGSSFNIFGYKHLYEINLAYISSSPVTVTVNTDGVPSSFTLNFPAGGSTLVPAKILVKAPPNKFKVASFTVSSASGVQVFQDLTEVWIGEWGRSGEYLKKSPFGAESTPAATI